MLLQKQQHLNSHLWTRLQISKGQGKSLHLPQAYAICELKGKNSVAQFQINWTLVCLISVYSTEQLQSDLQSGVN